MLLTLCAALLPSLQRPMEPMGELVPLELACVSLKVPRLEEPRLKVPLRDPIPVADLASLSRSWRPSITRDGRILALDHHDGVVHVFDAQGERVALCIPPDPSRNYGRAPWSDRQGRVFVQRQLSTEPRTTEIQAFTSDGTFQGASEGSKNCTAVDSPWQAASFHWGDENERSFVVEDSVRTVWYRRPDLQPWRAGSCTYLADGRAVVLDRYIARSRGCATSAASKRRALAPPPDPLQYLFVFDTEGRVLERLVLPKSPEFWGRAGAGRFVFLSTHEEGIWLVDLHLRSLWTLRLPESDATREGAWIEWDLVTRPDGSEELWVVERHTAQLFRYALPTG